MTPILISDAVARLKNSGEPTGISRQRIYQLIYAGKLSYIQRTDSKSRGRTRPGGRILIDWDEVVEMYLYHPKEK